jgi:2,3-bisphosphoglycerate-dependent phosphoglycerate mutase
MTTLCLIRHAHADWSPDRARPLSTRGCASAAVLADLLAQAPIAAIYSSPERRALETIELLSRRVRLEPIVVDDLRERELTVAPGVDFETLVQAAWLSPTTAASAGESNTVAQARGLAAIRRIIAEQSGLRVVVATHGNLLALILNAFRPAFGFDFWRALTFPDAYELRFQKAALVNVRRIWDRAA